jgi:hypothetical protein
LGTHENPLNSSLNSPCSALLVLLSLRLPLNDRAISTPFGPSTAGLAVSPDNHLHLHIWPKPTDDAVKPGYDAEHVRQLIRASAYTIPPGMVNVRFVHLPDEQKRRELMIIYAEMPNLQV